jgi:hypothetical protein
LIIVELCFVFATVETRFCRAVWNPDEFLITASERWFLKNEFSHEFDSLHHSDLFYQIKIAMLAKACTLALIGSAAAFNAPMVRIRINLFSDRRANQPSVGQSCRVPEQWRTRESVDAM